MVAFLQRRQREVLDSIAALNDASRHSKTAVLQALNTAVRAIDSSVDVVLVFAPAQADLECIYASGPRAEHVPGTRLSREAGRFLPARAALCAHRVYSGPDHRPVLPLDRAALAVPMTSTDGLDAVVYLATSNERIGEPDALAEVIEHATAPYRIAADREADRASATFDALTGLYTPRSFRERFREQLMLARERKAASLALWFIDTDEFKSVNDTLGHAAGDMVLTQMAQVLRDHLIAGVDFPARNGGDEFCAVVSDAHKSGAIERAQAFCTAVRNTDFGVNRRITASIGVAAFPYDAADCNALLEIADAAMYHSKRSGRDCVSFAVDNATFAVYA